MPYVAFLIFFSLFRFSAKQDRFILNLEETSFQWRKIMSIARFLAWALSGGLKGYLLEPN